MDSLITGSFEAVDYVKSLFRPISWSQVSTSYSSTAATPMNSDNGKAFEFGKVYEQLHRKLRATRSNYREPSLIWAMQTHRSITHAVRDFCLLPGVIQTPTGRLTSVDPRFPTDCDLDKIWALQHENVIPSQFANLTEKECNGGQTYICHDTDKLDKHVAYCIRHHPSDSVVVRLDHGKYEINRREVAMRWIDGRNGKRGHVQVIDGPMRQPLTDYLEGKEETAVYEKEVTAAIGQVEERDRLSFGDEAHQNYTRLEAMRVAKEQAKLRESAAKIIKERGCSWACMGDNEEYMQQYRLWHKAQLKTEPPMYQSDADDAQFVEQLQHVSLDMPNGFMSNAQQFRDSRLENYAA